MSSVLQAGAPGRRASRVSLAVQHQVVPVHPPFGESWLGYPGVLHQDWWPVLQPYGAPGGLP